MELTFFSHMNSYYLVISV